ncbi:DNA cytosine methyltransferase [Thalassospira tepidiphila]|uniref:Site-specific DNA-cytosine methylase n=1 Tax=Thalassospira tepidiphila TaxID=393657 RepID=A0ABX0WZ37_9PROT|nr:DNA cytosine methyltransferase [Thalassospira tepidiphila]NJB74582.1 site-specific DNA-cytosine methylase [Thalassospira tepidiphila]
MKQIINEEIKTFGLFCGIGAGLAGMNRSRAEVTNKVATYRAQFRNVGGIDVDPGCIDNFDKLVGVDGTVLDLFDAEQYTAWHGKEPGSDWKPAMPDDIRRAAGGECPDIVFTSPPCKGFSGLLGSNRAGTAKYQALNALTLRGIWLALEAFKDDPASFYLLENVPRIMTRGTHFLDQIEKLLEAYGYAVARTTHCCGELGGLAQKRRRFLLVARHKAKVPPFLYEPPKRSLLTVGDILNKLPMPGDERAGAMHTLPSLAWKTWLRLALIEPGKDWRSLNRLNVEDGFLTDFGIIPQQAYQSDVLGVRSFDQATGCVPGRSGPTNGAHSVADPRPVGALEYRQYGVKKMDETSATVTGHRSPGQGPFSVADPRLSWHTAASRNKYKVVAINSHSNTVIGCSQPASGAASVADPRPNWSDRHGGNMKLCSTEQTAPTVIGGGKGVQGGHISIADPRAFGTDQREVFNGGGHYGVIDPEDSAKAVTAAGKYDNGFNSVADWRLPEPTENLQCVIQSEWNTWNRPFSTYELAALQNLFDPEEGICFELVGKSHTAWREWIGNAVPPATATAIGSAMGHAILLARSGQTFALGSTPIWVRPVMTAISVDTPARGGVE